MTYPVVTDLLTNGAYGTRSVKPPVLICIHITSNITADAQGERDYANRAGNTNGPSAHDYINRDGSAVHAVDTSHWAWSNGILNNPKPIALITAVKAVVASGHNANQAYVREVECTGDGSHPVTAEQLETVAQIIAHDSKATGLAISRATVGQHSDLDTVNRPHCANLSEVQLAAVIARAKAILNPPPPPPPPTEEDVPTLATYIPGQTATVKVKANVRSAPKLAATVLRVVATAEPWIMTGTVSGDVDPDSGSTVWYTRFANGKWEYTALANLAALPVDPAVALSDKITSLQASLLTANANLSAASAGLASDEAKIAAAKAALG